MYSSRLLALERRFTSRFLPVYCNRVTQRFGIETNRSRATRIADADWKRRGHAPAISKILLQ